MLAPQPDARTRDDGYTFMKSHVKAFLPKS